MQQYYTRLEDANRILIERQRSGLTRDVEAWWQARGFPHATFFDKARGPSATLARQVATARFEDIVFAKLAKRAGLVPLWLQSTQDRLVSASPYKRSLAHPYLCARLGKAGPITRRVPLCSFKEQEGRRLREVVSTQGESLLAYHHERQDRFLGPVWRDDVAPVMQVFAGARAYYEYYLSFFIAHSVLFEDYHGGESGAALDSFTADVFEPAWKNVRTRFGFAPLIVSLPWWEGLQFYPDTSEWESLGIVTEEKLDGI